MGGYITMETLNSINIPKRKEDSHKGDYGKILLIGGSANLGGAIMLAARACVFSGSGLITVATHQQIIQHYILVAQKRWLLILMIRKC